MEDCHRDYPKIKFLIKFMSDLVNVKQKNATGG